MSDETSDAISELRNIIQSLDTNRDTKPELWLKSIREKLYAMFRSPMKDEYQKEAFKWVANLCLSLGDFSWLSLKDKWSSDEAKVFSCITRLSMNELHLLTPLIQRHLECDDQIEIEEGKIIARPANSEEYDSFGDHLVILEATIKSLVKNQNQTDDLSGDNNLTNSITFQELRTLLDQLKSTMDNLCEYLEMVHDCWPSLVVQPNSEKFTAAEGALRMICVWISEEPTSYESSCKKFLIDLFIKNLLLDDRPTNQDLLIMALHSVCTSNDGLMSALKETSNYKPALEQYLKRVRDSMLDNNIGQSPMSRGKDERLFSLRLNLVNDLLS